ncbi:MAG: 50S ribosomal protein L13 [Phycisphaerales bacterium]|nr:MAG: 50S ribosomal protein L13 [Phycisphaerales bacterium]
MPELRRQTTIFNQGQEPVKRWHVIDATDRPLGRLATEVATILMGKHRPEYTPHSDCGDYVIVLNASKVGLTGTKAERSYRKRYTGYPGGLKLETFGHLRERRPQALVEGTVKRMLPKTRLGRVMIQKLKVYEGAEHPHQAQLAGLAAEQN